MRIFMTTAAVVLSCGAPYMLQHAQSGALPQGPDFNGGFDRRPMSSYRLPDGGTAYEWPTSLPDGWTVEAGTWNKGMFALYGNGFDGGSPILCVGWDGRQLPCEGTGTAPNNSALMGQECTSYNGGCGGTNSIVTRTFPVSGAASYVLSVMMWGRLPLENNSGETPHAQVTFRVDWLDSAGTLITTSTLADDFPLGLEWAEHRFPVSSPAGAVQAVVHVDLARAPRHVRLDNLNLSPQ